jgi:hypothetical protein
VPPWCRAQCCEPSLGQRPGDRAASGRRESRTVNGPPEPSVGPDMASASSTVSAASCSGPRSGASSSLADGSSHVVPVWVDLGGDQIVFMTSADTVKRKAIPRDPRMSLCWDDERLPAVAPSAGPRPALVPSVRAPPDRSARSEGDHPVVSAAFSQPLILAAPMLAARARARPLPAAAMATGWRRVGAVAATAAIGSVAVDPCPTGIAVCAGHGGSPCLRPARCCGHRLYVIITTQAPERSRAP